MRNRVGVSLVEVLVATVLLAVGVAGCLSSVAGAARLRAAAALREALADSADRRLNWFEGRGCALGDSTVRSAPAATVAQTWRVVRDSAGVGLTGRATAPVFGRDLTAAFAARLRCP